MAVKKTYEQQHPPLVKGVRYKNTFTLKEPICKDGAVGRKARRIIRRGG